LSEATSPWPLRPLLAPWYRLHEDGDRLLLEHGQSVVVLEGEAVRALLPVLLPLLDGSRTVEDLVRELGPPARAAIERAVELLGSSGVLVDGPRCGTSPEAVAAAFGLSPSVAAGRLGAAAIGFAGSAPPGAQAARLLRLTGIGKVCRLDGPVESAVDLAVVTPTPDELVELDDWNRRTLDSGVRWLPVRPFDGRTIGIGPLIVPGETCCYACVQLRRAANLDYGADLPALERTPIAARPDPVLESLTAALVARLVLRFVVGSDLTVPGVLHVLDIATSPFLSEHPVLRVPRCPACSAVERVAPPLPWHEAA
jgi:bacteriocin biosynthesis cyclodehydratase domain-containing protein